MRTLLIPLTLLALAFAGCSNSPEGQSAADGGSLAYNGASNGSHSDEVESDGSCTLHIAGNLGSGKVTVTLTTSSGTTVQGSIEGPGQKDTAVGDASGPAGTWTLTAERTSTSMGPFSGQYVAHAEC